MVTDTMPNFAIKASTGFGGPRIALVNYFAGKPANQDLNDITEGESNARLIASAPDLLQECETDLFMVENLLADIRATRPLNPVRIEQGLIIRRSKLRAAIAKAKSP